MLFAAPWMLIGLAGLALPVIVHLLDRSRTAPVDWPTLRFLKIARQNSAQRTRLKNVLVLLARLLLLALLVLAMTQPYQQEQSWAKAPDMPTTLVLVLDNSFSMGYRDGAADVNAPTRFDRAKRLALQQIAGLGKEDEVALLLANEQVVQLTDRPTRDLDKVKALIDKATLSTRGTDLAPALTAAFALGQLDAEPPPAPGEVKRPASEDDSDSAKADAPKKVTKKRKAMRHVLLLTDFQKSAWQNVIRTRLIEKIDEPLPLTIVDLGDPKSANRFVRSVRVREDAALGSFAVEAEIVRDDPEHTLLGGQAQLWIDGQKAGSPELIPANAASKVTLIAPMPANGAHPCMVQLDGDRLSVDDTFYFFVQVTGGTHLTVVDGDPSAVPRQSETFYFNAALASGQARASGLAVDQLSPAQLSTTPLTKGGCLVLANVATLDGSALTHVENFLRAGGNVLVALGNKVDCAHYNRDWRFLPLRLDRALGDPARTRSYALSIEEPNHPIFGRDMDLSATRVFAFIGTDPTTLRKGGKILASFSNGSPAFIEGVFGSQAAATTAPAGAAGGATALAADQSATSGGKVLVFTSAIDADWSNLPQRRAFVPLVDRLVAYLTRQRTTWRSFPLARPLRFSGPSTLDRQSVVITTPSGSAQTFQAQLDPQSREAFVEYRDTDQVGLYTVQANEGFNTGGGFGVNLDTAESILTREDAAALKLLWGDRPLRIVEDRPADLAGWRPGAAQTLESKKIEYWPRLLVAAFLMLVAETLLANFFTRRRAAPPPPATEYVANRRAESTLQVRWKPEE